MSQPTARRLRPLRPSFAQRRGCQTFSKCNRPKLQQFDWFAAQCLLRPLRRLVPSQRRGHMTNAGWIDLVQRLGRLQRVGRRLSFANVDSIRARARAPRRKAGPGLLPGKVRLLCKVRLFNGNGAASGSLPELCHQLAYWPARVKIGRRCRIALSMASPGFPGVHKLPE